MRKADLPSLEGLPELDLSRLSEATRQGVALFLSELKAAEQERIALAAVLDEILDNPRNLVSDRHFIFALIKKCFLGDPGELSNELIRHLLFLASLLLKSQPFKEAVSRPPLN